ncbi:MAG TPA: PIG-L family deacetylase, partial [Chthonomonadaceae bacterium]|nr:PIG-L family deacetylase [Chthonomonadaceae bacterium]
LHPGPKEFQQFASLRQEESRRALAGLGVTSQDILFFGYPDRGLMTLWNDHWSPDGAYASPYTGCSASPYADTFHPGSCYCGSDVVEDIKTAMRAFHPNVVTVTHPAEDHTDHAAAAAFVTLALRELQSDPRDAEWARQTRLDYYLIHRGDWPAPNGTSPNQPLLPPAAMTQTDTHWASLPLTPEEVTRKAHSIERYPSQTTVMPTFLRSFIRSNELFGNIETGSLAVVPDGSIRLHADPSDWSALPPTLIDPVRDNVLRDLQGGGDIRALTLCRDSDHLYARLDMRRPISKRMTYTLRLRLFGPNGETGVHAVTLSLPHDGQTRPNVRTASRDRMLEAAIPWDMLESNSQAKPAQLLAVSVETSLSGVEIDKTGVRFLSLNH